MSSSFVIDSKKPILGFNVAPEERILYHASQEFKAHAMYNGSPEPLPVGVWLNHENDPSVCSYGWHFHRSPSTAISDWFSSSRNTIYASLYRGSAMTSPMTNRDRLPSDVKVAAQSRLLFAEFCGGLSFRETLSRYDRGCASAVIEVAKRMSTDLMLAAGYTEWLDDGFLGFSSVFDLSEREVMESLINLDTSSGFLNALSDKIFHMSTKNINELRNITSGDILNTSIFRHIDISDRRYLMEPSIIDALRSVVDDDRYGRDVIVTIAAMFAWQLVWEYLRSSRIDTMYEMSVEGADQDWSCQRIIATYRAMERFHYTTDYRTESLSHFAAHLTTGPRAYLHGDVYSYAMSDDDDGVFRVPIERHGWRFWTNTAALDVHRYGRTVIAYD